LRLIGGGEAARRGPTRCRAQANVVGRGGGQRPRLSEARPVAPCSMRTELNMCESAPSARLHHRPQPPGAFSITPPSWAMKHGKHSESRKHGPMAGRPAAKPGKHALTFEFKIFSRPDFQDKDPECPTCPTPVINVNRILECLPRRHRRVRVPLHPGVQTQRGLGPGAS
jgi:hypothetical protein